MLKTNKKPICLLLVICMLLSTLTLPMVASAAVSANADKDTAIFIEAESGKLSKSGSLEKTKDKAASGGSYVTSPGLSSAPKLEDPDSMTPELLCNFTAPADGNYHVWMRYSCKDGGSDSFFIGFNDEKINSEYGKSVSLKEDTWVWEKIHSGTLKAGANSLKFYHRENNLKVDAFYITADDKFVPSEQAALKAELDKKKAEELANRKVEPIGEVNKFDGHATMFEAESSASKGLDITDDKNASGKKAITMPNPSKYDRDIPEDCFPPTATYTVEIPREGNYYVWTRVYAANNGTDTSWICWDTDAYTKIEAKPFEQYVWIKASTAKLTPGIHTLNIVAREGGMIFDKIIVSSNIAYMPADLGDIKGPVTYQTIYPTPSFLPPAGHPRVYFTAKDIPMLKENLAKPQNSAAYSAYTKLVEDDSMDGNLKNDGNNNNFIAKLLAIAESKAFEYAINGNEERGKQAVSIMKNICQTMSVAKFDYNQAGQTIFTIAAVYDWCYPLLDDETKTMFSDMVPVTANYLEVGWPPSKQGAVTGHGVEGQIMRDLMCAGLAMYDERPDIYINTAGRFFTEFIEPKKFMYPAHSHNQGIHYAGYRFQWEMLCTWILDRVGCPRIFGDDQQYIMYQYLYTRRPDGMFMTDGDGSFNSAIGTYVKITTRGMFLAANYFKDPYLKWEAMRELQNFAPQTPSGNQSINPVEFLVFNDPDLDGKPVIELPLTHYNPSPKGGAVARTDWSDGFESPAVIAEMKINEYWFANHQHLDAGAFQIYYKGALATDTGYYQAYRTGTTDKSNNGNTDYGSLHFSNYMRRTIAHNTMLVYDPDEPSSNFGGGVNDGGQRMPNNGKEVSKLENLLDPKNGYKVGEILGHEYGLDPMKPNYTYLKGDIAAAYSEKVENYERSFMFLNLKNETHPAALLVFDRVISSKPDFKKTWLCHGLNEPKINGSRTVFEDTRTSNNDQFNGRLTIDTLLPAADNVAIEAIGGEGKEHWVNGTNYFGKPLEGGANEGGGWRVEISPKNAAKQDYFLNVLQMSDANGEESLPVQLIETDAVAGAVVADRVVVFGKDRDKTKNDVTFSFTGEGSYEITVADLQAGTWSVTKDGAQIGEAIATEDGGVGVFTGEAGSYTLSYKNANATRQEVEKVISSNEGITLRVNDRFIYSDVAPTIINDRTLVPMRAIFEKLGVSVEYDDATATATATRREREVKITENSTTAYIDGEPVELDVPAMILNDRFVVPVRFVSEAFDSDVTWQEYGKVVDIRPSKASVTTTPGQERAGYITIQSCTISDTYEGATGAETYDNDLDTLWSVAGAGNWICYDFGSSVPVKGMEVVWNKAGQRQAYFEIYVSDDNKNFTKVMEGKGSGELDLALEKYDFPANAKGRYLKVVTNGNSVSEWNAIIEIAFLK